MSEYQPRESRLLLLRKTRHVRLRQDIRGALVVPGMRDRNPDLMQARRPAQHRRIGLRWLAVEALVDVLCQLRHALRLRSIDLIAAHELTYGRLAHVAVTHSSEQIVENALTQRSVGDVKLLDPKLR